MQELEKIKIRDISTYARGEEKKPNIIEIEVAGIKFRVHRHIYCPGTWLLTCRDLNIEHEDMETDDMEEALHNAKVFMLGAIDGAVAALSAARQVLEETEEFKL